MSSLYLRGPDQPSPSVVRILTSSSATLRRLRVDLNTVVDGTSQDAAFRALRESRAALRERYYSAVMAATGLLYLAILTAFGTDLVARAVLA